MMVYNYFLKCICQNCLLLLNAITPPIIPVIEPSRESTIPTRDAIENTSTIIPQMVVASYGILLSSIAPMMTTIPEMSTLREKEEEWLCSTHKS